MKRKKPNTEFPAGIYKSSSRSYFRRLPGDQKLVSPKIFILHIHSRLYKPLHFPPISFLTQLSNPPSAIISCTFGGSSPTLTLHFTPSGPSCTVTVLLLTSHSSVHPVRRVSCLACGGAVTGPGGGESRLSRFRAGSLICC